MSYIKNRKHAVSAAAGLTLLTLTTAYAAEGTPPVPTSDSALPPVTVKSQRPNSYKADAVSSPKFSQPLVDTTQTISVIKAEVIREQGATNLTEALRNSPGVSTFFLGENGTTNTGDTIYMRGFDSSSSIYVDGIRDLGSITRDIFNIDQIDIIKGPAGADYGRSAPTGSVNLATKQPDLQDSFNASAAYGSADFNRVTADWNKTLGDNSAFRLNLMNQGGGVAGRDVVENKRWGVAPSLAFGLNTPTRVYLNYLHVTQNNIPDGGVPTIGLPGYTSPLGTRPELNTAPRVNSSNFYGVLSDHNDVDADMATVRIDHEISPTLSLRNTARYGNTSQKYLLTAFMGTAANIVSSSPNRNDWTLARSTRTLKDQTNEILTNQTNLTATVNAGGIKQTLVGGVEFIHEKQTTFAYNGLGTIVPANLYNPNASDPVTGLNLVRSGVRTDGQTTTVGVYVFDTVELNKQWQINGGVRMDKYRTNYSSIALSTLAANPTLPVGTLVPTNIDDSGELFNYKLGVLFKPAEIGSIYANYATSKQPPGGSNFALSTSANSAANPKFDPQETKTVEVGTKWDFLDKRLGVTAAAYRTEVSNEVVQNLTDLLYYQTGRKVVKGVEVGANGEITPNWSILAGFTTMDATVAQGTGVTADGSNNLAYTPKYALTSWTTYKLPSVGLTFGGGARYTSKLLRGTDGAVGTPKYADAYWVFDAMASYAVTKNVDVQLNLYNLADKDYVASINKSGYRYTPGVSRSGTLTVNFKF